MGQDVQTAADKNEGDAQRQDQADQNLASADDEHDIAARPKKEQVEGGNYRRDGFLPRRAHLLQKICAFVHYIDDHNGVVTALATVVLACLTICLAIDSEGTLSAIKGQTVISINSISSLVTPINFTIYPDLQKS